MFLLTDQMMAKYCDEGLLAIDHDDPALRRPTAMYFRLGARGRVWNPESKRFDAVDLETAANRELTIPSRGMATVFSKEYFRLSDQVMGLLGPASKTLLSSGIAPMLSPSIDPNFAGSLEFVLQNLLDEPRSLPYLATVGKIVFFDVRDTYPVGGSWYGTDDAKATRRAKAESPLTPDECEAVWDAYRQI